MAQRRIATPKEMFDDPWKSIVQIQDLSELDRLFDEALSSQSLADVHLPEEGRA